MFEEVDDFEIECLGEIEEYVYDIEIEDNHNFFANNILVHNSCFISLDGICDTADEADKFYKEKLDIIIKKCYDDLCSYLNAKENLLILKREKICSHYLITAPARYACLIVDKEGVRYKEPKLEITGMEVVRSSTPKYIKPYLKETLIKMMKEDKLSDYIDNVRREFNKQPSDVIAFPRSANNLSKWINSNGSFVSGTPIGVRAAINYNKYNEKIGKESRIVEGDKIKFVYMKKPNPVFNEHVMGFIRTMPDKQLDRYVDYKTQFDKVYYSVISKIANNVGINLEQGKETLEDIF